MNKLLRLLPVERGAMAIEYGLIAAVTQTGTNLSNMFSTVGSQV